MAKFDFGCGTEVRLPHISEAMMRGHRQPRVAVVVSVLVLMITMIFAIVQANHVWSTRVAPSIAPVCRVKTEDRVIAFTFDDGPDPTYTPTVLRLLAREGAHATFFVIGRHAAEYPGLLADILTAGDELGNHTWSHPNLTDLNDTDALAEIDRASQLLNQYRASALFRTPYGQIRPDTLSAIRNEGLKPIHWSVPLDHYVDSLGLTPSMAARAVAEAIQPGDVVLAHDARDGGIGRGKAMTTLRYLLPMLKAGGYDVVTVSDLLRRGTPVSAQPRWWFWQSGYTCPR